MAHSTATDLRSSFCPPLAPVNCREITSDGVKKECVAKLKNRKAAEADEIVNEFLKYGGEGMITMMIMLYNWIWENEYTPLQKWRQD